MLKYTNGLLSIQSAINKNKYKGTIRCQEIKQLNILVAHTIVRSQ